MLISVGLLLRTVESDLVYLINSFYFIMAIGKSLMNAKGGYQKKISMQKHNYFTMITFSMQIRQKLHLPLGVILRCTVRAHFIDIPNATEDHVLSKLEDVPINC